MYMGNIKMNLYKQKHEGRQLLNVTDISQMNEFTIPSSTGETHSLSMNYNRKLINEVIDTIFDERKGNCDVSSSPCSSLKLKASEYSFDKRLKYWKDTLKERENISAKIFKQTEKSAGEILYNRLSTVDERDKQMIKRLIDYAERMQPTKLSAKETSVLKEKSNVGFCSPIPELRETLPKSERNKNVQLEIVGLPKIAQQEILGKSKYQGCKKPFSWLKSKELGKRIEEMREDIERVVEYYPDIDSLQIVGESLTKTDLTERNSEIKLLPCDEIHKISTDTSTDPECQLKCDIKSSPEVINYGLKINDHTIRLVKKRSGRNINVLINFSCCPFQTEVKKVLTIHNLGIKTLSFEWVRRSYYDKNSNLLKSNDNEFLFDTLPFRLCGGEKREIFVKYQPRYVDIIKSKLILKTKPSLFCNRLEGITVNLCGICTTPPEYVKKLDDIQATVTEKSNLKMMRKLTIELSNLTPDLNDFKNIFPYQRSLNEKELFERLNTGFKCDRFNDLQLLKDLYKRVKKPRDKVWDLRLDTLKSAILNITEADRRALSFNELLGILEGMRGQATDLEFKIMNNPEEIRSCFLYVRGIISAAIDEWEDLTERLETSFYQTTLQLVNQELLQYEIPGENQKENESKHQEMVEILKDENRKHVYVLEKRVRKLKTYKDTLYLHTYTLICDFVENIVNVIEATDVI